MTATCKCEAKVPVGGRGGQRNELLFLLQSVKGVSLRGTASSADLGGSSKYSNENFED